MCIPLLVLPALIITTLPKQSFRKYEAPNMDKSDWEKINTDLKREIANLEYLISRANATDAALLGDQLNLVISKFVEARPEIFEKSEVKADKEGATYVQHQSKTMQQLKAHKKNLQRKISARQAL